MLAVIVTVFCASCSSSGSPSDTEAAAQLQSTSGIGIPAISAVESNIGSDYSGATVAQQHAAPLLLAQLEPEVTLLASAESVALSPGAAVELAALQADLAALSQPVAAEAENNLNSGTVLPGDTVSYQSIQDNGLSNGTYPTDDYYLAEFLYQNPNVCFGSKTLRIKPLLRWRPLCHLRTVLPCLGLQVVMTR